MARPAKSLQERVRDRSFLARRHGGLLAGPLTNHPELREIQAAYQAAETDRQRRLFALDFEQNVRAARPGKRVGGLRPGGIAPADFFPRNLAHVKGPAAGHAFKLEPWQRRFVEEFSRLNGSGERIYKRGMLGVARGNGKTPLAAGLALRELVARDDEPDVILAAAARDQARVCFEYARGFVESGPLADVLQVGRHEIRNPLNGGVLRTVSADGFVAHGLNPSACVIDELHAWSSGKQVELLDALDTAIHKRPGAFWLVITTAGHDKTSLLGRLVPPCITSDGVVYLRVPGRTVKVVEPSVLANLYDRGREAERRAVEALGAELTWLFDEREKDLGTERWVIGVAVAPVGAERVDPQCLFRKQMKEKLSEVVAQRLRPDRRPAAYPGAFVFVHQNRLRAAAVQPKARAWNVSASLSGAVAVVCSAPDENIGVDILFEDILEPAWHAAADILAELLPPAQAFTMLQLWGEVPLFWQDRMRELSFTAVSMRVAASLPTRDDFEVAKRELLRSAGFEAWEANDETAG